MRSTRPIGMPRLSAWTIAEAEGLEVLERAALGHRAHGVDAAHADLHLLQQAGELLRQRPVVLRATRSTAASKPRPASTDTVSRSMASGRALRMSVSRFWPALCSSRLGST